MTPQQTKLWRRLEAFALDRPGDALCFSRRLARENDWTHAYALRAIEEYKRFLLLAVTAGHPVTPSDQVDQVWHLHLLYTESYWDELCPHVLGRPLHHGPTRGGRREGSKYRDWYGRTLASYRATFDEAAPEGFWPPIAARFRDAACFRRVNTRDIWLLSKRRILGAAAGAGLVAVAWLAGGCAEGRDPDAIAKKLVAVVGVAVVGGFVGFVVSQPASRSTQRSRRHDADGGCGAGDAADPGRRSDGQLDAGGDGGDGGDGDGGCGSGCGAGCGGGCGGCGGCGS